MDYAYKTAPYAHQREAFTLSRDADAFALLMQMGTGKTKVALDNAAWAFSKGRIETLVVVAPRGVHRGWVELEVPEHLPDWCPCYAAYSQSAARAAERRRLEGLWEVPSTHLRIFTINYEATLRGGGRKMLEKLLALTKCMLVLDEGHRIKNPGSKTAKTLRTLGKRAVMRRLLTGTSVTEGPTDLWLQFNFLDPTILEWTTFAAFKAHYCILRDQWDPLVQHIRKQGARGLIQLVAADADGRPMYQNLDELRAAIAPHSYIATKDECLDLPEKIFEPRLLELDAATSKYYGEMLERAVLDLREGDAPTGLSPIDELWSLVQSSDVLKAKNAMTKLGLLQQILGGYVRREDGRIEQLSDYRIKGAVDALRDVHGSAIIWARYRAEVAGLVEAIGREFGAESFVQYHGGVNDDDRALAIQRFQAGTARFFIATQSAGKTGHTLTAATTVLYYSQSFSLEQRVQSEDRAHRIGQTRHVTYVDLMVPGTVDERVTAALTSKREVADEILLGGANRANRIHSTRANALGERATRADV